jgi:hypothetical protein
MPVDFDDDDKENLEPGQESPPSTQDLLHKTVNEVMAARNQQRWHAEYDCDNDRSLDEPSCTGETEINESPGPSAPPRLAPVSGRSDRFPSESSEINVKILALAQPVNSSDELSVESSHIPIAQKTKTRSVDSVDDVQGPSIQRRELRTRTAAQTNPYEADKIRHQSQARGKKMTDAELNQAVKRKTKMVPQRNVRTRGGAKSRAKSRQVESDSDSVTVYTSSGKISRETSEDEIRENTTLSISVQGQATDAVLETSLSEHSSLTTLIDFVNSRWGQVKGGAEVRYLTCERPWKSQNQNLIMYPGWDEQFHRLFASIKEAPVWRTKGSRSQSLEVSIVATLTARNQQQE